MNVKKAALALALGLTATTANAIPTNRFYSGTVTGTGVYPVDVPCVINGSDFCPTSNNVDIPAGTAFLVSMSFNYGVSLPLPVGPAGEDLFVSTSGINPHLDAFILPSLGVEHGGFGSNDSRFNSLTDNHVPFGGTEPADSLFLHWDELPTQVFNFQGVEVRVAGPATLWTLLPGTTTLNLASLIAAGGDSSIKVSWRDGGPFPSFTVAPETLALSISVREFDPGPFPSLPEPAPIALLSVALAGLVLIQRRK